MFSYLVIINLDIIMFKASLVPLTQFLCIFLNFAHHGFMLHRTFQNMTSIYGGGWVYSTQENEICLNTMSKTLNFEWSNNPVIFRT